MLGLVCPRCKHRLYAQPPQGGRRGCWESQPAAYSLKGKPCFVYTLIWEDYRIRSLHPPDSTEDARSPYRIDETKNHPPPERLF